MSQNPLGPVNIDVGANGTLLSEVAVAPGTYLSGPKVNSFGIGAVFGFNTTQLTGTLTLTLQGQDQASGSYYTLLSGTLSAGFAYWTVCPGCVGNATTLNLPMPRTFQVKAVLTGTSASFTVGASLIQ